MDLRDRIALVLFDSNVRGRNVSADDWGDPEMRESFRSDAQAVIDELGLVEERTVRVVDHGAGEVRIPESRVVGKWER